MKQPQKYSCITNYELLNPNPNTNTKNKYLKMN